MILCRSYLLIIICNLSVKSQAANQDKEEELYRGLFKYRRLQQLEAIRSLIRLKNYEKQYSMINLMAEKIFGVLQDNRALIEASGFIPGVSPFPIEDGVKSALSNILENTALFSEVILRLPDISVSILKSNNNWDILLQWSIGFANQVKYLYDNSTAILFHLVSQELNHIERDPNYQNPYWIEKPNAYSAADEMKINKRVKKKLKKGPRFANEL